MNPEAVPARLLTGFAFIVVAGAAAAVVPDTDGDLVPDAFDNCLEVANGPNQAPSNQVGADGDGYGNACDMDFDQSGYVGHRLQRHVGLLRADLVPGRRLLSLDRRE